MALCGVHLRNLTPAHQPGVVREANVKADLAEKKKSSRVCVSWFAAGSIFDRRSKWFVLLVKWRQHSAHWGKIVLTRYVSYERVKPVTISPRPIIHPCRYKFICPSSIFPNIYHRFFLRQSHPSPIYSRKKPNVWKVQVRHFGQFTLKFTIYRRNSVSYVASLHLIIGPSTKKIRQHENIPPGLVLSSQHPAKVTRTQESNKIKTNTNELSEWHSG